MSAVVAIIPSSEGTRESSDGAEDGLGRRLFEGIRRHLQRRDPRLTSGSNMEVSLIIVPSSTKKGKRWNSGAKALLDAARNSHQGLFNRGDSSRPLAFEVLRGTPTESSQFQSKNRTSPIGPGSCGKGARGLRLGSYFQYRGNYIIYTLETARHGDEKNSRYHHHWCWGVWLRCRIQSGQERRQECSAP